jgi:hypothetical protein
MSLESSEFEFGYENFALLKSGRKYIVGSRISQG